MLEKILPDENQSYTARGQPLPPEASHETVPCHPLRLRLDHSPLASVRHDAVVFSRLHYCVSPWQRRRYFVATPRNGHGRRFLHLKLALPVGRS